MEVAYRHQRACEPAKSSRLLTDYVQKFDAELRWGCIVKRGFPQGLPPESSIVVRIVTQVRAPLARVATSRKGIKSAYV